MCILRSMGKRQKRRRDRAGTGIAVLLLLPLRPYTRSLDPHKPEELTVIGYKLFRKRKDGTYGPLFINCKQRLVIGPTYKAEAHLRKGYAFRPGWHICAEPYAPHLSMKGRVWCRVKFTHRATIKRPASQGGIWYLGSTLRILSEC